MLLREMEEKYNVITTKEIVDLGFHKDTIKKLRDDEQIIRIANGLYGLPGEDVDDFLYFNYRVPSGVFSHETAAYLHKLTTVIPSRLKMTVKSGDNISRLSEDKDKIEFRYIKRELLEVGQIMILSPFGNEVRTYDKERTVVDLIRNKDRINIQVFTESINEYFNLRDRDLTKLIMYSREFKVEDKVRLYTEVLQ